MLDHVKGFDVMTTLFARFVGALYFLFFWSIPSFAQSPSGIAFFGKRGQEGMPQCWKEFASDHVWILYKNKIYKIEKEQIQGPQRVPNDEGATIFRNHAFWSENENREVVEVQNDRKRIRLADASGSRFGHFDVAFDGSIVLFCLGDKFLKAIDGEYGSEVFSVTRSRLRTEELKWELSSGDKIDECYGDLFTASVDEYLFIYSPLTGRMFRADMLRRDVKEFEVPWKKLNDEYIKTQMRKNGVVNLGRSPQKGFFQLVFEGSRSFFVYREAPMEEMRWEGKDLVAIPQQASPSSSRVVALELDFSNAGFFGKEILEIDEYPVWRGGGKWISLQSFLDGVPARTPADGRVSSLAGR